MKSVNGGLQVEFRLNVYVDRLINLVLFDQMFGVPDKIFGYFRDVVLFGELYGSVPTVVQNAKIDGRFHVAELKTKKLAEKMAKKSVKKNIPSKKIQKGLENFEINLRDFRINQNEMLNRENKINY